MKLHLPQELLVHGVTAGRGSGHICKKSLRWSRCLPWMNHLGRPRLTGWTKRLRKGITGGIVTAGTFEVIGTSPRLGNPESIRTESGDGSSAAWIKAFLNADAVGVVGGC